MKKVSFLFVLLILATVTFAQAPQAFNYQAVVRDANGNLLQNQAVGIKISLLQGSATGQEVYAETHTTTTNQFGQVDLKIGTGAVQTGQFTAIPWKSGNFYLKLAVDITGGTNYQIMGTTQMLSVPYALYAEEGSGWEKTENGISYLNGNVGIGTLPHEHPVYKLNINGNIRYIVSEAIEDDTIFGYFGRGKAITGGWATLSGLPNALTITYDKKDFAIGGWAKDGSGWKGAALIINSDNGNIGIGTLPNDYNKLNINGGIRHNFSEIVMNDTTFGWLGRGKQITGGWTWNNCPDVLALTYDKVDFAIGGWAKNGSGFKGATLFINSDNGNVGIGTTTPMYPLTVNGTIRSKKVIVDTGWSDFVFEDDYSLMPLHQLDKFIEENKHLPEIPSAKEVEANGISLGEMDAKLLQKIEELTLYTIEQQKKIDELEKEVKKLNKRRSR